MRAVVRLLVALCCVVAGLASARAERRVALIVGNASYAHIAGLPNVRNDAAAVAALLKAARFDTIDVVHNLGVAGLRRALKMFAGKAADADVAVLYYAGHGIEVGQTNYLIPVDARLPSDFDVEDETMPLDRVLQAMEPVKRLRLVILDACRENPFLKSMKRTVATRSVGRGLGRVEPTAPNTLIAFATKPNAVAEDGEGPNSPFTAALVKHLLTPGLDLRIALGKVRDEVMAATGGRQEPYVTSSLGGDVVAIVPGVPGAGPLTPAARPNEAAEAWAAVKDSTSVAALDIVAKRYKGTVYADLAQAKIAEITKQRTALAQPPTEPGQSTVLIRPLPPHLSTVRDKATPLTPERERSLKLGDSFKECDACPEMIVVPAGEFIMGSPETQEGREANEGQQVVTITQPFAVGKFEVTYVEWEACVAVGGCSDRPYRFDAGSVHDRVPVVDVSWNDIYREYLPWLSSKSRSTYRLLTEAEWEYAARAVTSTKTPSKRYWWGDEASHEFANYGNDLGSSGFKQGRDRWEGLAPVGQFPPNPFGLYDMHGNAMEWVQDCGPPVTKVAKSDCRYRGVRGGSWSNSPRHLRSAFRFFGFPERGEYRTGFRVARDIRR